MFCTFQVAEWRASSIWLDFYSLSLYKTVGKFLLRTQRIIPGKTRLIFSQKENKRLKFLGVLTMIFYYRKILFLVFLFVFECLLIFLCPFSVMLEDTLVNNPTNIKRHSEGTFSNDYSKYLETRRAQDFIQWLINSKRSGYVIIYFL